MTHRGSTPLCAERIVALIETFGDLSRPHNRAGLTQALEDFLSHDPVLLAHTPDFVIDPASGLRFYPQSLNGLEWGAHIRRLPRNSPHFAATPYEYLQREYAPYIAAGLLYSGHLKQCEPHLYNALCHPFSAGNKGESGLKDGQLRRLGILGAGDLNHPAPHNRAQVETILMVNIALGKRRAVEKALLAYERRNGVRTPAVNIP